MSFGGIFLGRLLSSMAHLRFPRWELVLSHEPPFCKLFAANGELLTTLLSHKRAHTKPPMSIEINEGKPICAKPLNQKRLFRAYFNRLQ